jgi:hypothetical protein
MTNPPPCPKCQGTGFDRPGHICDCVSHKNDDIPDCLRQIFGIFDEGKNE